VTKPVLRLFLPLVLPSLLSGLARADEPAPAPDHSGLYLGHSWVANVRKLAIFGKLHARSDTWVLARFTQRGGKLEVEQQPCDLAIKPVGGVRVGLLPGVVPRLPPAHFDLETGPQGLVAAPWRTGWDVEDLDTDGEPGVTFRVQAVLCGGDLDVSSETHSAARAAWEGADLVGELDVDVAQRILAASGGCLKLAARDSLEHMEGRFRYTPAPAGTTCASAARRGWPQASEIPRP